MTNDIQIFTNVQLLNIMLKNNSDQYYLLKTIQNKPTLPQRELAKNLGFSLGKLNYCLKSLKEKGLIKISNYKKSKSKFNYLYLLTPKGFTEKTKLTIKFMKLKMKEYDELRQEYEKEINLKD